MVRAGRPALLFVTVCTHERKPVLSNPLVHGLLSECWRTSAHWRVGRYVVMPDHIHLFCSPTSGQRTLARWVQYWKSVVSLRWPRPAEQPIWQPSFWDTQVRGHESYSRKWDYVRLNPVRRGLVETPDAWPYAGEIDVLDWP
ncbi:MAG: transposase [Deltaproteobacteria bacterium]|nr:transposase [Deltaproteobacteria bacterium]